MNTKLKTKIIKGVAILIALLFVASLIAGFGKPAEAKNHIQNMKVNRGIVCNTKEQLEDYLFKVVNEGPQRLFGGCGQLTSPIFGTMESLGWYELPTARFMLARLTTRSGWVQYMYIGFEEFDAEPEPAEYTL